MTALETSSYRIEDARSAFWFGRWPGGWGDVVHGVAPGAGSSAAAMIDAAEAGVSVLTCRTTSPHPDGPRPNQSADRASSIR